MTMQKEETAPIDSSNISSLGIRLMRKDDLVVVSASNKAARSPDNFQRQFHSVHLSSNIHRILSLAVDYMLAPIKLYFRISHTY